MMKAVQPLEVRAMANEKDPMDGVQPGPEGGALPGGVVNPNIEAQPQVRGPECPRCGDRFPSQESLDQHMATEHKP
jgi:hypothetical protein